MEYILVDFFDTIFNRKYSVDILKHKWSELVSEKLKYKIEARKIFEYRLASEYDLSIINKENDNEYKLIDVFVKLITKLKVYNQIDINVDDKKFAQQLCEIHYNLELDNLILDSDLVKQLKKYKSQGYKIFCVSDCEYDISFYKKAFTRFTISDLFDDIYVSCEYKKSKRSGELYKQILSDYQCLPHHCLMIGDNKKSDQLVPKLLGIRTNPIKYSQSVYKKQNQKYFNEKCNLKILNRFFVGNEIIFCNYFFALYEFSSRLYKELIKNGQRHVFFAAREGQFLKKIFDAYQEDKSVRILTHYLEVSRASTFVPSLKLINQEKFENLFRQYSNTNVENFLKSLNFDSDNITVFTKKYGNEIIKHFEKSNVFSSLVSDPDFIDLYTNLINKQKTNFTQYMKQLCNDFDNLNTFNIVDVGWKGTIQDNISNIFPDKKVVGYYIGLNQDGAININNCKHGLLFDWNIGKKTIYNFEWINWEYILKANHGKTMGYKFEGGKYKPIFIKDSDVDCYELFIKDLQEKIYLNFIKLLRIMPFKYNMDYLYTNCQSLHKKMYKKISFKDLDYIDKVKMFHSESFGVFGNIINKRLAFKRKLKIILKFRFKKGSWMVK